MLDYDGVASRELRRNVRLDGRRIAVAEEDPDEPQSLLNRVGAFARRAHLPDSRTRTIHSPARVTATGLPSRTCS